MSGMDELDAKTGVGVVGVGAVACAACCAGPVLGFLSGVGLTAALSALLFGTVGVVALIVAAVVLWRRRRARRCSPTPAKAEPVAVETPSLRARS